MNRAVTDSQALIWYALGKPRKLGRNAKGVFARAERGQAIIYIPTIVLVEVAEAMRRGVIRASEGFGAWSEGLFASRQFVAADLSASVVREAEGLYSIPERGDRLIAATAIHLGCPLLTNDPAIARVRTVATIW